MTEAWMLDVLGSVRDAARAKALFKLAEHIDDAMLLAASEFHEALLLPECGPHHDGSSAEALRGVAGKGLH